MFGLRVYEKIVLVSLALMAVSVAMLLVAGFGVFGTAYRTVQLSRFNFVATETRTSIEYLLSLGLPLQESSAVQRVIDTARGESSGVRSVAVYNARGRIIYSTDIGEIGDYARQTLISDLPSGNMEGLNRWARATGATAVFLENGFGQNLGAIAVRYEAVDLRSVMEQAVFFLGKIGLAVFAAGAVSAVIGINLSLSRIRRRMRAIGNDLESLLAIDAAAGQGGPESDAATQAGKDWETEADYVRYRAMLIATFGKLGRYEQRVSRLDEMA